MLIIWITDKIKCNLISNNQLEMRVYNLINFVAVLIGFNYIIKIFVY